MDSITLSMIFVASQAGLPGGMLQAVCGVESGLNPRAIHHDDGGSNSIGLCQIKLSTARWLGYQGTEEGLFDAELNASYAAKYLAYQMRRYGNNTHKAIAAYNAGRAAFCGTVVCNNIYVSRVEKLWRKPLESHRRPKKWKTFQAQGLQHGVLGHARRSGSAGARLL
jgi:soluble lytic murein transglycosylase-like protein